MVEIIKYRRANGNMATLNCLFKISNKNKIINEYINDMFAEYTIDNHFEGCFLMKVPKNEKLYFLAINSTTVKISFKQKIIQLKTIEADDNKIKHKNFTLIHTYDQLDQIVINPYTFRPCLHISPHSAMGILLKDTILKLDKEDRYNFIINEDSFMVNLDGLYSMFNKFDSSLGYEI